ncbi:MAG: glycosyltransferase [Opitutales bacterium]|nr:glycosyltransferase [Opitutales bacterium]
MKISVITVNFNNREGLARTLESSVSLRAPSGGEKEIIIIDGGSTDGSVEEIQKVEKEIAYWCSERDRGIFHAMNKGIARATGDYCIFMNSGDTFASPDVLEKIFSAAFPQPPPDVITGATYYCDSSTGTENLEFPPQKISLGYFFFGNNSLQHQSSFIRTKRLFEFPYDETLKITSDFKFWLQCLILNDGNYVSTDVPVAKFDTSGISSRPEIQKVIDTEIRRTYADLNLSKIITDYEQLRNLKWKLFKRVIAKKLKETFRVSINFR